MVCKEVLPLMHEYLDGDLTIEQSKELKNHLTACEHCRHELKQLENTEALIRSALREPVTLSNEFTDRFMESLPSVKKQSAIVRWIKRHPGVSVAAIFVVVMFGSFLTLWDEDPNLMIKGAGFEQVIIKGNMVYVPEGTTVHGDLIVKGAEVQVDGHVEGNVVVIDGSLNTASLTNISGKISYVNQVTDWIWFKLNEMIGFFSK